MVTVPEAVKRIVERSRYLSEAISKDLINLSSLARYIKPELEEMLIKDVSSASIAMALKRLQKDFKPKYSKGSIFKSSPEIMIRSGLVLVTIVRTRQTEDILNRLFISRVKGSFPSITIGAGEITIASSISAFPKLEENISKELFILKKHSISQVTIALPQEAKDTPGVYYFFLKSLAWEGINIAGIAATNVELTLFFEDSDVNRAFEVLTSLFTKNIV